MNDHDWTGGEWDGDDRTRESDTYRYPPDGYDDRRGRGGAGVVAGAAVVSVLALLGIAGFLYLAGEDGEPGVAAPSLADSSSQEEGEPVSPSPSRQGRTPEPSRAPQHPDAADAPFYSPEQSTRGTSTTQRSTGGTSGTGGYPSGADRSGWTSTSGARCNAGDPAQLMGRTETAWFVICENPDNGRYYYKGVTGSGSIEIDDPTLSGSGATVRNRNVVYSISPERMRITENGSEIWNQTMQAYWTR